MYTEPTSKLFMYISKYSQKCKAMDCINATNVSKYTMLLIPTY